MFGNKDRAACRRWVVKMSEFTGVPQRNASVDYKPQRNEARFGDGYAQRSPKGLNNNPQNWKGLRFHGTENELDAIEAFFELKGGVTPFTWTPPGKSEAKFICPEWAREHLYKNISVITANFEQDFS